MDEKRKKFRSLSDVHAPPGFQSGEAKGWVSFMYFTTPASNCVWHKPAKKKIRKKICVMCQVFLKLIVKFRNKTREIVSVFQLLKQLYFEEHNVKVSKL